MDGKQSKENDAVLLKWCFTLPQQPIWAGTIGPIHVLQLQDQLNSAWDNWVSCWSDWKPIRLYLTSLTWPWNCTVFTSLDKIWGFVLQSICLFSLKYLEIYPVNLPLSNVVGEEEGGCCSGPFSVESEDKVKKSLESVCCAFITLIHFS